MYAWDFFRRYGMCKFSRMTRNHSQGSASSRRPPPLPPPQAQRARHDAALRLGAAAVRGTSPSGAAGRAIVRAHARPACRCAARFTPPALQLLARAPWSRACATLWQRDASARVRCCGVACSYPPLLLLGHPLVPAGLQVQDAPQVRRRAHQAGMCSLLLFCF